MNVTEREILEELNREEAKKYVGGVVFVALLMTAGIVGNLHVLLVYALRIKPSNHRVFILTLGVLDFTTSVIGMPFILVDLRNPFTFEWIAACKILRFVNYFICMSSGLLLVVIAIDRYRKICVPFGRQMSLGTAKLSCVVVMGVSAAMSWPAPILYGRDTVVTSYPNINGTRCYEENRFRGTKYMAYFNALLILIFFAAFIILVVLYALIWRRIKTMKVKKANKYRTEAETSMATVTTSTVETTWYTGDDSSRDDTSVRADGAKNGNCDAHRDHNAQSASRTTIMFFLITAVFLTSYFPHLTLKIITFMNKSFVPNMSFGALVTYNTFIWCFFINNMANAFIYGFFDRRFRAELKDIYSKIFFCRNDNSIK